MKDDTRIEYAFIIILDAQEISYASVASGENAVEAVRRHYLEMDAYCSPVYEENHREEFCVEAYRLPIDFSDDMLDDLSDMEGEELGDQILEISKNNKDVIQSSVKVVVLENGEFQFYET